MNASPQHLMPKDQVCANMNANLVNILSYISVNSPYMFQIHSRQRFIADSAGGVKNK